MKNEDDMRLLLPREKLLEYGAASLSDTELLALFLRTGRPGMPVLVFARELLTHFGTLRHLLSADYDKFREIDGIGVAKYAQLHAVAELSRRYYAARMREGNTLSSPKLAQEFLSSQLADEEREIFLVIFLDSQNNVIGWSRMFAGTLTHVEVHAREIVREAFRQNAASVILAHNHPSGRAEPSRADREMTERIARTCRYMDIQVLDHLVIGRGEYVSFAERGWI